MALSGSFTGTGQSANVEIRGLFTLSLYGAGVGTVKIEKSYDNGTTWLDMHLDDLKTVASWSKLTGDEINPPPYLEPSAGDAYPVLYRLNCTAHSSGTISYRLGG